MTRDQRGDVKLAGAVEPEIRLCDILAQQPIGADHPRTAAAPARAAVDHDQMVANPVERADVAANQLRGRVGERSAFLEEHAIAKLLSAVDLSFGRRQTKLQWTERPKDWTKAAQVPHGPPLPRRRAPRGVARPVNRPQCHDPAPRFAYTANPQSIFRPIIYDSAQALRAAGFGHALAAGRVDRLGEPRQIDRLGQEVVDAGAQRRPPILLHRVGGQRDDRHRPRARFLLGAADAARGFEAVEAGHLDVHQDNFETGRLAARRRLAERRRFAPVVRPHDFEAEPAQRLLGDRRVDLIVLGEQRARRTAR